MIQQNPIMNCLYKIKSKINVIKKNRLERKIIPFGSKVIYHGKNGWENCKCYCGHFHYEDLTYDIYRGWDLCHVPMEKIERKEWEA